MQELMEESNRLQMELADLEEQTNRRESEILKLEGELKDLEHK